MAQAGAIFVIGETYLRMKDTGHVFPFNEEQSKLVKKDQADFVKCTGKEGDDYQFEVVKNPDEPEPKKISTPARKPEPPKAPVVQAAPAVSPAPVITAAPKIDLSTE